MKAMLLSAGVGSRMRPLTDSRPKPALPVLDRPMLLWLIEHLADQGIDEVIVNVHAHPEALRAALAGSPIPVAYSPEPELLGSGGGIRAARGWLADSGTFLVVNGDMLLDLDVAALLASHREGRTLATLALRDDPRKRDFGTIGFCHRGSRDGDVTRITELWDRGSEQGSGLFIGVHALEPEIFERMPDRDPFQSFRHLYVPMLRGGERIGVWLQDPAASWTPIGTPRELLDANLAAARACAKDGVWIGSGARIPASADVGPDAVIGAGARVPEGARLRDVLLLPGARPPADARLERAIGFDDRVWNDD